GKLADVAGDTLGAHKNRLAMSWESLFDTLDTSPMKKLLDSVAAELNGEGGKKLNLALMDIFHAIDETLLKPIASEGGKIGLQVMIEGITSAAHDLADAIRTAKPLIEWLFKTK